MSNLAAAIGELPHVLIFDNGDLSVPFRRVTTRDQVQGLVDLGLVNDYHCRRGRGGPIPFRQEGVSMVDIEIVDVQPQMVMGMTRKGPYKIIAQMIPELFQYLMPKGAQIAGPPVFVCHETSVEEVKKADVEGNAEVEIAVPVAKEIEGTDQIRFYELPGGKMAKTVHKGPYEECEGTYQELFAWICQNQKRITGPTREIYLNDPREVPPEEILTEIYAPIE
jgi:effector-binding domain-containing protein